MCRLLCYVLLVFALGNAVAPEAEAFPLGSITPKTGREMLVDTFISPAQAAAEARAVSHGRVLAVHLVTTGPQAFYQVRLLVGGQIRIVRIDAHDGRVLR